MPSPTYSKLLATVTPYVEKSTAEGAIGRQLGSVTPDTFQLADLQAVSNKICIALKLYVPDPARRDELLTKIKALAA